MHLPMKSTILVTGGAGYIGSHATVALLDAGYDLVVLDNLSRGYVESIVRIECITGKSLRFIHGDVRDATMLDNLFAGAGITGVLHFAGLKYPSESIVEPLNYYEHNVLGTTTLLRAMERHNVRKLVFSSSASVYGVAPNAPVTESQPAESPITPYARSKRMAEHILEDIAASDPSWSIAILRYFNPVGAHASGLIGEDCNGNGESLMANIGRVVSGRQSELGIYGKNHPTHDGTCLRDFIHVMDLAEGHILALNAILKGKGVHVWNLGTGTSCSVLQVVREFETASGLKIPLAFKPARAGDCAASWSDPGKALRELGWKANRGLDEMMRDAWCWQRSNPSGYNGL